MNYASSPRSNARPARPPQIVRGNRNDALRILKVTSDEQIAFITYLNYAVNNLAEVAGVEFSDERKVRGALFRGEPATIQRRIQRLADFLWTFQEKNPAADESGYKRVLGNGHDDTAVWVAERIVALRNFFVHVNGTSHAPLILDHSQYVFVEGILGDAARKATMAPGLNPSKAQKLKLATHHVKEEHSYEFTRKGLIFLTCLGLYKDEAEEFCHLFAEMKVPDAIDDEDLEEVLGDGRRRVLGLEDMERFKGLKGKGRALIELFTFYSYRRGRQSLDAANLDFMCFADIVGCLNKVPAPAFEFLPLEKERAALAALAEKSTEDERNKRTKYVLRRRDRNRFLSLAAAYCEDFKVLPSIRFKRLDIRQTTGRHQYVFGDDVDAASDEKERNRVRMNRHYAIRRDAIAFEFVPDRHYGPIRIGALRSAMSATEMRRLLYFHAQGTPDRPVDVDACLRSYFEAYHRILERMVNAGSLAEVSLDDETYLADFAAVCGTTQEAFKASPESFRPFVPESLRRYFTKETGTRTDEEMLERLRSRLWASYNRSYDILVRHDALEAWRKASRPWLDARDDWRGRIDIFRKANPKQPLPPDLADFDRYLEALPASRRPVRPDDPRCRIGDGEGEISNPPTWCLFSDADYVSFVFDYINLFLPNDRKFRQLPISEQHREGLEDHLFQMVHTAIGKFSLDQKGLWTLLDKFRPELKASGCTGPLRKAVDAVVADKPRRKDGKSASATLEDLSIAAVTLTSEFLQDAAEKWDAVDLSSASHDEILAACRRFGVRPGMPVETKSLMKTILGIDYDAWRHAFDYSKGKPFENRRLEDDEHIAAQIPLPNGFADRLSAELPRKSREPFLKPAANGVPATFDFNAAFRAWSPDPHVALRDFYDVAPLVESLLARKHPDTRPDGTPRKPSSFDSMESRTLDAAIRDIKDFENQDKVLLFVAMKYWGRFQGSDTFSKKAMPFSEKTMLREFFDTPVEMTKDGMTVSFRPNDVNRPAFATLFGENRAAKDYRQKLAGILSPDGSRKSFDFYELVVAFREQKARDRHARLTLTPFVVNFDAKCEIPSSEYDRVSAGLKGDKQTEAVRALEFERYKSVLPGLTREDYDLVADARNAAFHTGFKLDFSKAIAVCKRLGISGTLPGGSPAGGNNRPYHHGPNGRGPRRSYGPPRGSRW